MNTRFFLFWLFCALVDEELVVLFDALPRPFVKQRLPFRCFWCCKVGGSLFAELAHDAFGSTFCVEKAFEILNLECQSTGLANNGDQL